MYLNKYIAFCEVECILLDSYQKMKKNLKLNFNFHNSKDHDAEGSRQKM